MPSRFRPRLARPAASEVFSAALIVSITLALSYAAYSLADFHISPEPVYSTNSFSVYGTPSILHIQINSSAPTSPAEFRLDGASSTSGFLALTARGYSSTASICSPGKTTFFSVETEAGTLAISGPGISWIDGVESASAVVQRGWHAVIIADGSGCVVDLPGGLQVSGPSPAISAMPMESASSRSFNFLVPYYSGGHVVTLVFDGGTQVLGF